MRFQIFTTFVFIIVFPFLVFSQSQTDKDKFWEDYNDYNKVQAFTKQDTNKYVLFYSSKNGKVIDSLKNVDFFDWICIVINRQSDNWVEIGAIGMFPGEDTVYSQLSNSWIQIDKLWVDLSNDSSSIYEKANDKTPIRKIAFQTVNLVNINKNWIEIKYKINDKIMTGWIRKEDQCGSPWTVCNWE